MTKNILFFFLLLIFLTSVFSTEAFRISAGSTFDYKPGTDVNSEICMARDNEPILIVELFPDKLLDPYIDMERGPVETTNNYCVPYTIQLPEETENQEELYLRPGENKFKVSVMKKPDEARGMIGTVVTLKHVIKIFVPYPGKYLEPLFKITSANQGEPIAFDLTLTNKGSERIGAATGTIAIYDEQNTLIHTLTLPAEYTIDPEEQRVMHVDWKTDTVIPGRYWANVSVAYDGISLETGKQFKVGSLYFSIVSHSHNVTKGGIRGFTLTAENQWADEIPAVFAEVDVYENNTIVESFSTLSQTFNGFEKKNLKGFVNTEQLSLGEKLIGITLHYSNETTVENSTLYVLEEIVQEEPKEPIPLTLILMAVIGVLVILLLIGIIIYFVHQKKKK